MEASTLSTRKATFLRSQIRLLSQPLQPSPTLTTSTDDSPSIPLKTLDEVISRVNEKVTIHNKSVFSAQSQRHIIEQIESLYFADALNEHEHNDVEVERGEEKVAIQTDVDLTSTTILEGLPEELNAAMLHDISDLGIDDTQAEEYVFLRRQLLEASVERDTAREKLARYEKLKELLGPFENVQEGTQGNLVTRDGELAREMERMRVLVARVVGRLGVEGGVESKGRGEERESRTFDEKLKMVMDVDET